MKNKSFFFYFFRSAPLLTRKTRKIVFSTDDPMWITCFFRQIYTVFVNFSTLVAHTVSTFSFPCPKRLFQTPPLSSSKAFLPLFTDFSTPVENLVEVAGMFVFFLGKLLKKFSQTLSKLSQHIFMCESFYFLCRTSIYCR